MNLSCAYTVRSHGEYRPTLTDLQLQDLTDTLASDPALVDLNDVISIIVETGFPAVELG